MQVPVGVVVERARVVGWRGTVDGVARGVGFWQLVRLGVAGRAWASLVADLGAMSGGRGWLAGEAIMEVLVHCLPHEALVLQHSMEVYGGRS